MVLDSEKEAALIDFVRAEPRAVQEIAEELEVAWATAERYVDIIQRRTGSVQKKVFRAGTRGALKLVYYAEQTTTGTHKWEELWNQIRVARWKEEFDPMDIKAVANTGDVALETTEEQQIRTTQLIQRAENTIHFFTGNYSFLTTKQNNEAVRVALEDALRRGVEVKGVARVNLASIETFSQDVFGHESFQNKHRYQPVRGLIIDENEALLKGVEREERYKKEELQDTALLSYQYSDNKVASWITKVFWNMYRVGEPIQKRLQIYREL